MNEKNQPVTLLDFLQISTDYLISKGIDDARLNVQLMLGHILRLDKVALYMKFDYPLSPSEIDQLRSFLKRRISREPLQHILGEAPFLDFSVKVNRHVLIPRPETEELVDLAVKTLKGKPNLRILEIGTGSGIIPIALAKSFPDSKILSLDISPDALKIAAENAEQLQVLHQITFQEANYLTTEIAQTFDCIISNPPYIEQDEIVNLEPEVRDFEPITALTDGADGLSFYKRFIHTVNKNLTIGGYIFLELNTDLSSHIFDMLSPHLSESEIVRDMQSRPRIFKGRK